MIHNIMKTSSFVLQEDVLGKWMDTALRLRFIKALFSNLVSFGVIKRGLTCFQGDIGLWILTTNYTKTALINDGKKEINF